MAVRTHQLVQPGLVTVAATWQNKGTTPATWIDRVSLVTLVNSDATPRECGWGWGQGALAAVLWLGVIPARQAVHLPAEFAQDAGEDYWFYCAVANVLYVSVSGSRLLL